MNIFLASLCVPNPLLAKEDNSMKAFLWQLFHLLHCGKFCWLELFDNSHRPIWMNHSDLSLKPTPTSTDHLKPTPQLLSQYAKKLSLEEILKGEICIQSSANKTLYMGCDRENTCTNEAWGRTKCKMKSSSRRTASSPTLNHFQSHYVVR